MASGEEGLFPSRGGWSRWWAWLAFLVAIPALVLLGTFLRREASAGQAVPLRRLGPDSTEVALRSLNASLQALQEQYQAANSRLQQQGQASAQRWKEVQAGLGGLQGKLESLEGGLTQAAAGEQWKEVQAGLTGLQARLAALEGGLSKAGAAAAAAGGVQDERLATRGLVFDSAWGRAALEKLRSWRSTLFLRMAERYTQEEKTQTAGGIKPFDRVEPPGWGRYDVALPYLSCPSGNVTRVGGQGDGSKLLCLEGFLNQPGCIIYSLGSNGQYEFEEAMLNETVCDVHTFDCTWEGRSLDKDKRHFYHKVCLGRKTRVNQGLVYWDWPTIIQRLEHQKKQVSLLKIDIEGYEFDVLAGWKEQDGCSLPLQVAMEVHYQHMYNLMGGARVGDTDFSNLFWPKHKVSMGEMATWFGHFANLGYAIVSKDDNPLGPQCCSEFTMVKVEQPAGCPAINGTAAAAVAT